MTDQMKPLRFINEPIEAFFERAPLLEKKPGAPAGFIWRGERYLILEVLSEWHDYERRGRMSRNMQPKHASAAERRGSWGVGQDYYRVRAQDERRQEERLFDIYYDRAPKDVDRRKGAWFLDREMSEQP
jgi:Domain of unknown function (DUF6504)